MIRAPRLPMRNLALSVLAACSGGTVAALVGCSLTISTDDLLGGTIVLVGDACAAPGCGDATVPSASDAGGHGGSADAMAVVGTNDMDATMSDGDDGNDGSSATYSVGGAVSGLASGQSVILQLETRSNSMSMTLHANTSFTFSERLMSGDAYTVTARSVAGDAGTVFSCGTTHDAFGTVGSANVSDVSVICTSNCVLFEACIDFQQTINISSMMLSLTGDGLNEPAGTHTGDCDNYHSDSGVDLYNPDGGVYVLNGRAIYADGPSAVQLKGISLYALNSPSTAAGDSFSVGSSMMQTSRGSIVLQSNSIMVEDDATGAGDYSMYICQ